MGEVTEAKTSADAVINGELDKGHSHYAVGLQMQRMFSDKVPLSLGTLSKPEIKSYDSYSKFYSASVSMVKIISKIIMDNRYLPIFLEKEMGIFGNHMNKLINFNKELELLLESKKNHVENLNTALDFEKELDILKRELISFNQRKTELSEEKKSLDLELSTALSENKKIEEEESEVKQKINEIQSLISNKKKKITEDLSPFQRQFRKMQRITIEKRLSADLAEYISETENKLIKEVEESGDYPSLKKILTEMKVVLERGDLEKDEKIRSRRLDSISELLSDSLTETVKELISHKKASEIEEQLLRTLSGKKHNISDIQQRLTHNLEKLNKIEENESSDLQDIKDLTQDLESALQDETGKSIQIVESKQ